MFSHLEESIVSIFDAAYETEDPGVQIDAANIIYDICMDIKAIEFCKLNTVADTECSGALDNDLFEMEVGLKKVAKECKRMIRLLEDSAQEIANEEYFDKGRFDYMSTRF